MIMLGQNEIKLQEAIREIHDHSESLFKLLVASLSPCIFGHDLVKAGLLLGLFGGKFIRHSLEHWTPSVRVQSIIAFLGLTIFCLNPRQTSISKSHFYWLQPRHNFLLKWDKIITRQDKSKRGKNRKKCLNVYEFQSCSNAFGYIW